MSHTKAKETMVKMLETSHEGFRRFKEIHKKGRTMLKRQCKTPKAAIDNIRIMQRDHKLLVKEFINPITDIDLIKTCTVPKAIAAEIEEPENDFNAEQDQIECENWEKVEENSMNTVADGGKSISVAGAEDGYVSDDGYFYVEDQETGQTVLKKLL